MERDEIIGLKADLFFTSEDRRTEEPQKELATATRVGQASDDRWIVRKDTSVFWCAGLTIALRDSDLRGFAKVMRDLTDMKQALEEVTHLNAKLQATIQTLDVAQNNLQEKVRDFEKFEDAVVGREVEMIRLKRQLKDTELELERVNSKRP